MTHDPTPSVTGDPAVTRYCDTLLLALRMREMPGTRIGAVLGEVRSHVAESGEDPVDAFGTPEDYAAALSAEAPPRSARERASEAVSGAAIAFGGWVLVDGASGLASGDQARVGPLPLLGAVLAALGAPWVLEQLVADSPARRARGVATFAGAVAGLTALGFLIGDWLSVPVPAAVAVALGMLAFAAGSLALRGSVDPVVDPLDPPGTAAARRRRDGVLAAATLGLGMLLLAAVAIGLVVLVEHLA